MAWIRGKLLGAGAFGSVNLAINREDGEVFAVKSAVVNDGSEVAVKAIENEISLLQELDSRYVVRCLGSDWTEEGGELKRNVFLEYMPEGCLTDFVKQFGSLDEHLLRTYTRSIVEGIEYLHSRGIVHCDVKGKNVLVGNGSVKLTDFGSAKRVGDDQVAENSAADVVVKNCAAKVNGTPLWMAPEVVRQVEQGPASDIWSLGCTVVEMATGRAPWSNLAGMNHFVALYHIGCTDELPAVPSSLSAEAHDFLSHCFQRDPRRRWTSAQLLQHPFLTARFVAPASPISVMQFPDSENSSSDGLSASFVNSVPTLAPAPSTLFKRGLVSQPKPVQDQQQQVVEENWWSTPASPDSGPWIVVRSPKSSTSSPPSFALSDSPVSDRPIVEAPIEDLETNPEDSEIFLEESTAISVTAVLNVSSSTSDSEESVVGASGGDDSPLIQIATSFEFRQIATGFDFRRIVARFEFRRFAISEMDSCRESMAARLLLLSGCEELHFSSMEEDDGAAPLLSASLNLGFESVLISTIAEYSVHRVYQYSNPEILLYWWHSYRKRLLQSSSSHRESEKLPWKLCGHSDQCIIESDLDQYTMLPLILGKKTPSLLALVCVCHCVAFVSVFHFAELCVSLCYTCMCLILLHLRV